MKKYGKLVRDKVPDIIRANGTEPKTHIARDAREYRQLLDRKLREEVREYLQAHEAAELADILEVVEAIGAFHDQDWEALLKLKQLKRLKRGGFTRRIVLDEA